MFTSNQWVVRMVLVAAALAVACDEGVDLDQMQKRWEDAKPGRYVSVVCGTGLLGGRCTRAVVMDDEVIGQDYGVAGEWTPAEPDRAPIDPLQEMFDTARNTDGCRLRDHEEDPEFHYLASYFLDCGEEGFGDEVRCFEPGTVDPDACP